MTFIASSIDRNNVWVPFSMHHTFSNQIWSEVSDNTPYTVSWCQRIKLLLFYMLMEFQNLFCMFPLQVSLIRGGKLFPKRSVGHILMDLDSLNLMQRHTHTEWFQLSRDPWLLPHAFVESLQNNLFFLNLHQQHFTSVVNYIILSWQEYIPDTGEYIMQYYKLKELPAYVTIHFALVKRFFFLH